MKPQKQVLAIIGPNKPDPVPFKLKASHMFELFLTIGISFLLMLLVAQAIACIAEQKFPFHTSNDQKVYTEPGGSLGELCIWAKFSPAVTSTGVAKIPAFRYFIFFARLSELSRKRKVVILKPKSILQKPKGLFNFC